MTRIAFRSALGVLLLLAAAAGAGAVPRDLSSAPTLYVVGYAHLDTEWRWEYPQVIREFLPNTLRRNFALLDRYPHYVFNFTGSNRYQMIQEYFPADFARLKGYVAAGRWFPAGSSVEESDVNVPSAESILRQVLYGNEFFRQGAGHAERGVHASGLLRVPGFASQPAGARGHQGVFHPEAGLGFRGARRGHRVARADASGNPVQRGYLDGARRAGSDRRAEPG